MTFKSCPMVYHATKGESFFDYAPGHFYWAVSDVDGERRIWMMLPRQDNDEGSPCCIPVQPAINANGASWGWDGNLEKPTLTPSVFHDPHNPASPHHWHGWVTQGEMRGV
jgi:Family of unknown function (DUF6527)